MNLRDYIVTIVTTVILNEILLLILPEGTIKKYIKVICAIIVLILVISPVIEFFKGGIETIALDKVLNQFEQSYIEKSDIDIYQNYVDNIFERNSSLSEYNE